MYETRLRGVGGEEEAMKVPDSLTALFAAVIIFGGFYLFLAVVFNLMILVMR